jgi:hypothetical protein
MTSVTLPPVPDMNRSRQKVVIHEVHSPSLIPVLLLWQDHEGFKDHFLRCLTMGIFSLATGDANFLFDIYCDIESYYLKSMK